MSAFVRLSNAEAKWLRYRLDMEFRDKPHAIGRNVAANIIKKLNRALSADPAPEARGEQEPTSEAET